MGGYEELEGYMVDMDKEIFSTLCGECEHECYVPEEDDEECPALEISQEISDQICEQAALVMKEILKEWIRANEC